MIVNLRPVAGKLFVEKGGGNFASAFLILTLKTFTDMPGSVKHKIPIHYPMFYGGHLTTGYY